MAGIQTYADSTIRVDTTANPNGTNGVPTSLDQVSQRNGHKNIALYVVPVSYHYTLNKFLGFGAGLQLSANLSEKIQEDALHERFFYFKKQNIKEPGVGGNLTTSQEESNTFAHLNTALFLDVTAGSSRIGPMAGARYVYNINAPNAMWQFYVLWKF
jgi:hypothetical protein